MPTLPDFAATVLQNETATNKVYAGVGSRETPGSILSAMIALAKHLAQKGWTLRSGGATGADAAFEEGCDLGGGKKEIFLPWRDFNKNPSSRFLNLTPLDLSDKQDRPIRRAIDLASQFHPLQTRLLTPTQKMRTILTLMVRNSYQVLGESVTDEDKSQFLVCWTPNGVPVGGTRQAIVIAQHFKVPVFNLGHPEVFKQFKAFAA
jgi:hypothetical protein